MSKWFSGLAVLAMSLPLAAQEGDQKKKPAPVAAKKITAPGQTTKVELSDGQKELAKNPRGVQ